MNERIRILRKELHLTQEQFAKKLGLKQNTIALIESGKRNTSPQTVLAVCREFDVNEAWLRTGKGEMFIVMDMEDQLMAWAGKMLRDDSDSFKKRFLQMLMGLTEAEWDFLEEKARELISPWEKTS